MTRDGAFIASASQNRRDPAGRLQRLVVRYLRSTSFDLVDHAHGTVCPGLYLTCFIPKYRSRCSVSRCSIA
jgi:hypothetical protein